MLHSLTTRTCGILLAATAGLFSITQATAQTVVAGFEGGSPFAPGGGVTINRFGDTGVEPAAYGINPTEGLQSALFTTFGNGTGNYPAGSPVFGASGSLASSALWGSMFPGSSTNSLAALNLVSGSAITLTLTLAVGDTLSFDWNFLTSEAPSTGNSDVGFVGVRLGTTGNPLAFASLGGIGGSLVATPGAVPHFDSMTGYNTYTFTASTAGSYTFGIGVGDHATEAIQSGLMIDNVRVTPVPEPMTMAYVVAGLGVFGLMRRRK